MKLVAKYYPKLDDQQVPSSAVAHVGSLVDELEESFKKFSLIGSTLREGV